MGDEPAPDPSPLDELARAKVNLFLHVLGRREDGRHELESLAVFPETGDVLSAERSPLRGLALDGPFGMELGAGTDNIVLRAVEALAGAVGTDEGVTLRLDKRLPVASGIGGGSADAAATLRLLMRLWGQAPSAAALRALAVELGADVPVCVPSAPAIMRGVGERLSPAPRFPDFWLLLVNPLQSVPTGEVFRALERRDNPSAGRIPAGFATLGDFTAWLARQRNDLEAPARGIAPVISAVLGALRWTPSCRLARMSGSGATCFGVFGSEPEALEAAREISRREPGWWAAPARVAAGGGEPFDAVWDAFGEAAADAN